MLLLTAAVTTTGKPRLGPGLDVRGDASRVVDGLLQRGIDLAQDTQTTVELDPGSGRRIESGPSVKEIDSHTM